MVLDDIVFNDCPDGRRLAPRIAGVETPLFALCSVGVVEAVEVGPVRLTSLI